MCIFVSYMLGDKPYICPWEGCNKGFSQSQSVTTHMRVHTGHPYNSRLQVCTVSRIIFFWFTFAGEKPFKCPFEGCAFEAAQRGNLNIHLRTAKHKGESPQPQQNTTSTEKRRILPQFILQAGQKKQEKKKKNKNKNKFV